MSSAANMPGWRRRFGVLYALAQLGGHLAYVPLFALLLPRRALAIAPGWPATLVALVLFCGWITASISNILAGRLSDHWQARHGHRRAPLVVGVIATACALLGVGLARQPVALIAAMLVLQASLNLMLAPLGALLADVVPHGAKGRMAALIACALPLANLGTGLVAWLFPGDGFAAFALIAGLTVVAMLPLGLQMPVGQRHAAAVRVEPASIRVQPASLSSRHDFVRAWVARLLVQLGAALVLNYFYLFLVATLTLGGRDAGAVAGAATTAMGWLAAGSAGAVALATPLAGMWSDHRRRRRQPMVLAALASAAALALFALGHGWVVIAAGYLGFSAALTVFLALDTALVAQLLSGHPRRGEWLGYMNLTNTLPAILIAALALIAASTTIGANWPRPWGWCFALAGGCAIIAAALVRQIRSVD